MEKRVSTACRPQNTNRMSGVYHSKILTETLFFLSPRSLCFSMATDVFAFFPPRLRALVHTSPAGVSTSLERKRDKISRRCTARARSTRSPPERLSGQKTAKQKRQRFSVHIVPRTNQKGFRVKKGEANKTLDSSNLCVTLEEWPRGGRVSLRTEDVLMNWKKKIKNLFVQRYIFMKIHL